MAGGSGSGVYFPYDQGLGELLRSKLALSLAIILREIHHHWATLELLHNDPINGKNVHVGPLAFVLDQIALCMVL